MTQTRTSCDECGFDSDVFTYGTDRLLCEFCAKTPSGVFQGEHRSVVRAINYAANVLRKEIQEIRRIMLRV